MISESIANDNNQPDKIVNSAVYMPFIPVLGYQYIDNLMRSTGVDGVHLLPLYGVDPLEIASIKNHVPVVTIQDAYNPTFLHGWRMRYQEVENNTKYHPDGAKLDDLLMSPTKSDTDKIFLEMAMNLQAKAIISTHFEERYKAKYIKAASLIRRDKNSLSFEISPRLNRSTEGILESIDEWRNEALKYPIAGLLLGKPIAYDTYHVVRPAVGYEATLYGTLGKYPFGPWQLSLKDLWTVIGSLHFHPENTAELIATINKHNTELHSMMLYARYLHFNGSTKLPQVLIEFNPIAKTHAGLNVKSLRDTLIALNIWRTNSLVAQTVEYLNKMFDPNSNFPIEEPKRP